MSLYALPWSFAYSSRQAGLFTGEDLLFSSLVTSRNGQEKSQSVRVVQGDRFREEEKLPAPDVMMIDVEGFEKGVMSGLQQTLSDPQCRAVIPEGSGPEQIAEIILSLKNAGKELDAMGQRAQQAVREKYNWEVDFNRALRSMEDLTVG